MKILPALIGLLLVTPASAPQSSTEAALEAAPAGEHHAPVGTDRSAMIDSGYVTEAPIIRLAEAAGFERAASEQAECAARYRATGESDRVTLRFRQPE